MAIDQSVINFAVYEDSVEYLGMSKVTLPDVTFLTQSISGAGVGGNVEAVILGHLEAMTLGIPHHHAAVRPVVGAAPSQH